MGLFGGKKKVNVEPGKQGFQPKTSGRNAPTAAAVGPRGPVSPVQHSTAPSEILSTYDRFSATRPTGPTGPRPPKTPQGYTPIQRPQGPVRPHSIVPKNNSTTTLSSDFSVQQDRVQYANNLSTQPEILAEIYQTYDDIPTLSALASNKNAPTHVLEDLGRRNINDTINKRLSQNINTPVKILHTLVNSHRNDSDVHVFAKNTLATLHHEGRIRPNDIVKLQDDGILPRK